MDEIRERSFLVVSGLALLAGGAFFLWGGSAHPGTGAELGQIGTDPYFRAFARKVADHEAWERIHAAMLAGPLLWALGTAGAASLLSEQGAGGYGSVASMALGVAAATWTVTFVLDGFIAPLHAVALVEGGGGADVLHAFRSTQEAVVRLGLVGWLLVGVGMASLGAGVFASHTFSARVRWGLAVPGILLGGWPVAAWLAGVFRPGPFTSILWVPTAVLTTVWFLALGSLLLWKALADIATDLSAGRREGAGGGPSTDRR